MKHEPLKDELFLLSPLYTLPDIESVIDFDSSDISQTPELESLKKEELYILSHEKGTSYLINPTIKLFLLAFEEATTLNKVTQHFAEISNSKVEQIESTMLNFFNSMQNEGIIVQQTIAQEIIEKKNNNFYNFIELQVGEFINDYEIITLIAKSGPTQLYKCLSPNTGEEVIVKTIYYPEDLPVEIRERSIKKFRQEFKLMSEFKGHPNICQLLELKTDNKRPYAAIEYIDGQSLRAYVKNNDTSIDEKIAIIRQLLNAISFVQSKKVIHGDIHLSNFLVKPNGQLKLIDFDLSNHVDLEENEIIRNGGVHECIPPERIKINAFSFLKERGDFRSEVFQLGVMIYYILYQKYPFSGFTWNQLAQSICETELVFEGKTKDGQSIPSVILELLQKAMQKKPEDRYENAQEMLNVIEKK